MRLTLNNEIILLIGIATSLGFLLNLYITPILIYLSHRHGIYDTVDHRKIHTEDTSRLGGIGIFFSFIISASASPFLVELLTDKAIKFQSGQLNILFLLLSLIIIFLTGVLDDFAQMRARYKLVGQFLASIAAVLGGAVINRIHIPFTDYTLELGIFAIPLTLIWLVGITNSLNLIDGIDGLSSGISIIASMIYAFVFLLHAQYLPAIICYALVGALFGYLFFNFPPAKIFMGDSGSLFLGFILAMVPITAFPESSTSLVLPVTMLLIPIMDVLAAIWRRKREKRNIFSPDRFHVHHKMMNLGLSTRNILAVIYGLCFMLGITVIIFESTADQKFIYVLIAWLVIVAFFLFLHYKKNKEN